MMEKVELLYLITGDEIIASVKDYETKDSSTDLSVSCDKKDLVSLKNPMKILITQQGLGMIPFLPFSKEGSSYEICKSNIICRTEPETEFYNEYISKFNGIVKPSLNFKH
jgi:hypothetical protein